MFKQKDNTDAIVAAIFVCLFLSPDEVKRNVTTEQEWILELSRNAPKRRDLSPEEQAKQEVDIANHFDLTGEEEVPPLIFGDDAVPEARTRVTAKLIMPCYRNVLAGMERARENDVRRQIRYDPENLAGARPTRFERWTKTIFSLGIWILVPWVVLHFVIKYW